MAKYDLVNREISTGRDNVRKFCLWEKQFSSYNFPTPLLWKSVKAKKENGGQLPASQGVYAFVVRPAIADLDWCGYILYVGQTESQTFKKRYAQYFSEPRKRKPRLWVGEMFTLWKTHLYYYYAELDAEDAVEAEDALLTALLPPNNERFPGDLGKIKKEIYK